MKNSNLFKMNTFALLSSLLLLSACGGGGGAADTPVAATPIKAADPVVIKTGDLAAKPEFNFSTQLNLTLDVAIEQYSERAYLNVCREEPQTGKIDYSNCVYRGALVQGQLMHTLELSHQGGVLHADIWQFDGATEPERYQWQYQANASVQRFEIR
ncbi:hypothetical protein ORJ66_07575 [Pseudoalteromonas tunicata]|uniref:hypothetical protein n=1 Tax=Pseudoalteromonas tunicata TaxID=314281 RepID=UPI00273FF380|nr:hypothetical protein [Pseudoalteromonas tunicata]MDP5212901.1 hypothetical protein [Pseudoalteromonas tunicata]